MSCEMISSRKIDYYVNDPYVTIIDISNKDKIYIFYCDKGAMSLVICEKMSGLGYICKTVVGGFEAYKGMCVIN